MMLEQLKNYIKANTDVGEGIQLGGIDGNTEKYIGVYPGKPPAAQRVCLGGAEQTRAGEFYAAVLVHWGRNMRSAQAKADAVYALFYARGAFDILPAAQGELGWAEWVKLVGGLMDDTPLGRVVAVRSESDANLVRSMPQWQKQLRTEWAAFRAKRDVMRMGAAVVRSEMDALERMMAKMFGGE